MARAGDEPRLAFTSVAVPKESVTALPTEVPFNEKLIVTPDAGIPPHFTVAVSVVVPP